MKVDKLTQLLEEKLSPEEIRKLFMRASEGDASLLQRDDVATLRDHQGWSLLDALAYEGVEEVLDHPLVASKDGDKDGWSPLHIMAHRGNMNVLKHPDVDKVQNDQYMTPLDFLSVYTSTPKKRLIDDYHLGKTKFKPLTKKIDLD